MTFGIIDIGSNTIRMNIYQVEMQQFNLLMSTKDAAGLVSYVQDGALSDEGIEKLANVLTDFKIILMLLHVDSYAVFATASLRNISNSSEVVSAIEENLDMNIDLLSGQAEGSLSFKGALLNLSHEQGMYIDTGGGSTEVVMYNQEEINFVASMPIGSLNLYNEYVKNILPTRAEAKAIEDRVIQEIQAIEIEKGILNHKNLAVTGGSFRAVRLLLVHYKWLAPDCYEISPHLLERLLEKLLEDESAAIRAILKVKADRLPTLMTGLIIVLSLAKYIGASSIQVSTNGLREGYLMHHVLKKESAE
jgi:exopolyphosphatase/guanosine-5'-triphosphate,3'-diphosphate pyrophosphatase